MKIARNLLLFLLAALVSCEQPEHNDGIVNDPVENPAGNQEVELVKVVFTGSYGSDTKTTLENDAVFWEESDRISLLSGEDFSTLTQLEMTSLSSDRATATFEGLAVSGSEAFIALYPGDESYVYDNGAVNVCIPSEQSAVADGFESGSNVSVAVAGKDSEALQFKNVSALLQFSFRNEDEAAFIKSVTFKAKKSDTQFAGLSGRVAVTLDADNLPVASEGDADYLTVTAPEGGFRTGCAYYVPVCPVGSCSGMQIILTDKDGCGYVRENEEGFALGRNRIIDIGELPACLLTAGNEGFGKSTVRVGIMGDSISTFHGMMCNYDYKYHYPCEEDELMTVEQTWWWQLIYEKMENGVLDVNNSFSGTRVVRGSYTGVSGVSYEAGFVDRVEDFKAPHVIIIHGGTNDVIKDKNKDLGEYQWDTPLDQMNLDNFRSAYVYLVRKLQELYEGVQLVLIVGDRIGDDQTLEYDESIIEIAGHFNLPYVNLIPHRKTDIPTPDNCHPNAAGHAFIAQKIYDTCKDYLK